MNKTLVAFTLILATAFAAFSDIQLTATYSMASSTGNIINGGVAGELFGSKVANAGKFTQATYDDFIVGAKGKAYVIKGQSAARTAAMDLITASASNFITLSLPTGAGTSDTIVNVAPAGKFSSATRDSVIVSMPGWDITGGATTRTGKAYIIYPRDTDYDWSSTAFANDATHGVEIVPAAGVTGDKLGAGISTAGDVIGDTLDDVVISYKNNVLVIAGTSTAPTAAIALAGATVITGLAADTDFGAYIAGDFDFNGDTKDDFVVGAPATDKAYVFYGQSAKASFTAIDFTGTPDTARYTVISHTPTGIKFGFNVANAGDVNNDGADDLIVGAPEYSTTGTQKEGRTFVLFGEVKSVGVALSTTIAAASVTTSTAPKGYHITGSVVNLELGYESDGVGDINADGYDDIIVSAPGAAGSRSSLAGKVYVIYGKATASIYNIDLSASTGNNAFTSTSGFTITGETGYEFGASVSYVGDVTGDGAPDFVVGSPASLSRSLPTGATARATPGVVYQFNGQAKTPSGSGFRLEASLLVIVSFFAALMF